MKKQIEKEDDRRKKKEERIKIEQLNMVIQISYHTTFCTTIYDVGSSDVSILPHFDPLLKITGTDFIQQNGKIFSAEMSRT